MNSEDDLIDDKTILITGALFTGLETHLTQLVNNYKVLEDEARKQPNEILRKWYNLCNENYAISRTRVSDFLCGKTITEKSLTNFQYQRQIGIILMPIILNFVNSYEYISTLLRMNSDTLKQELDAIIKPKVESLRIKWSETDTSIKDSVITIIENTKQNTSKMRKALANLSIIDSDDVQFLSFVWDIRNAMHNNFVNTQKIKYTLMDKDSSRTLIYEIEAGAGISFWDTPKWNIVITERLAEIMAKIIAKLNDLPKEKSKTKDL